MHEQGKPLYANDGYCQKHAEILLIFAAWLMWFHTRMTSDTSVSVSGIPVGPRSTHLSFTQVWFAPPLLPLFQEKCREFIRVNQVNVES